MLPFAPETMPRVRARAGPLLASLSSMTIVSLLRRLRDEFTAMPGLRLNEKQVQRLCGVSASTSARALRALVSAGFLRPLEDGSFRRADVPYDVGPHSTSGAAGPPRPHIPRRDKPPAAEENAL
jgi:hypothetical protein